MRYFKLAFLLLGFSVYSQPSISKQVIGPAGATFENINNKLSYTIGELAVGATSQKLISEVQWAYDNVSSLTVKVKYDYSFDGDGYVTYVTIGKYFLNEQNEYLDSEITYKLTYTN